MKKILYFTAIIFLFFSSSNVYAKDVNIDEIEGSAYIIGTHMFTRNQNDNYDGVLTTQLIMLASKTIKSNDVNDMIIYYRNPKGVWKNALTGENIENVPISFEITHIDTVEQKNKSLESAEIKIEEGKITYDGTEKKPKFTVTLNDIALVENQDYTTKYENNIEVGIGKITITGIGEYNGTKSINFEISPLVEHLPTSEYDYSFDFNSSQINATILTRFNDGEIGSKTNGNFDFINNELVISTIENYADSYDIYSGANILNADYTDIKYIGIEVENRSQNTVLFNFQGITKLNKYFFLSSTGNNIYLVDEDGTINVANGKSNVYNRYCIYLSENFKGKILIPVDRMIDSYIENQANLYTKEPIKKIGFFITDETYKNSSVVAIKKLFITKIELSNLVNVNYSFNSYIKPFWKQNIMYDEPVTLHLNSEGTIISGKLLFKPTKIISVKDYSLKKNYNNESDYYWNGTDNIIYYGNNSTIPFFKPGELSGILTNSDGTTYQVPSYPVWENGLSRFGDCLYTVSNFLYEKQIVVTYEYDISQISSNGIAYTKTQNEKVKTVVNKMNNGESLNILIHGDSILAGYDASSLHGREPYLPTISDYISKKLNQYSKGKVTVDNIAVGGWTVEDGYNNLAKKINESENEYSKYDLAIIGFGMNNPNTDLTIFKTNIENMISLLKAKNPNIEIILLSSMNPNPRLRWDETNNYTLPDQKRALKQISDDAKYNSTVAYVDMYSIHNKILEYKDFSATTGNNVNHPNDWLIRVYAQNILSAIIDY